MICKKCNTAVDDNEKVCSNCGAPLKDKPNGKIIAGILAVIAIIAVIYFAARSSENDEFVEEPNEIEDNDLINEIEEMPENPQISEEVYQQPVPIENSTADLNKAIDDVWAMLDETVGAVYEYYEKYCDTVAYVSKNGYFYEVPSNSYVQVSELLDLTSINPDFTEESILFFYLKPKDLKEHTNLKVSDSKELKIFAAYETKEGFAITSKNETGGIITREDLLEVLSIYSWDHGPSRKVVFGSEEFDQVMAVLNQFTKNEAGFDVRHLYRDDQYISVVVSPKDDVVHLMAFVLEDLKEVIVVRESGLENSAEFKVDINEGLPNFNFDILPDYSIYEQQKYLVGGGFDELVAMMIAEEIINESALPLTFANGALEFVYFEFSSGEKFVGYLNNNTWAMTPVEEFEMASILMYNLHRKPPLYILKQY